MKDGPNVLLITLRETNFEMDPCLPKVKASYESFRVSVDWSVNEGTWKRVVLKDFAYSNGSPCPVDPSMLEFAEGDGDEQKIEFLNSVSEDTECKFTVELQQISPNQTIGIDPVIILKRGP